MLSIGILMNLNLVFYVFNINSCSFILLSNKKLNFNILKIVLSFKSNNFLGLIVFVSLVIGKCSHD